MKTLDQHLYRWINIANEHREKLRLPVGHIESAIAQLRDFLGLEWLETTLLSDAPVEVLGEKENPLRKWLLSASLDKHVVQALEVAALLREFSSDTFLNQKINRLKHAFWPAFFELSLAARMNRSLPDVARCRLTSDSVKDAGDFVVDISGLNLACECARLTQGPEREEPKWLLEQTYRHLGILTKKLTAPTCIKVRSTQPLNGPIFNRLAKLSKRAMREFRRDHGRVAVADGGISVEIEVLGPDSEPVPFHRTATGEIESADSEWNNANVIRHAYGVTEEEFSDRFRQGIYVPQTEHCRILVNVPVVPAQQPYRRVIQKIQKKIKQTKLPSNFVGKIVLVETPFPLRESNLERLREGILKVVRNSNRTAAVVLANREPNPHFRHHYSMMVEANRQAITEIPALGHVLRAFQTYDLFFDLILNQRYTSSWAEAQKRALEFAP